MTTREIIAQIFGLIGLCIIVSSFQCKKNRNFFLLQGIGSLAFVINFFLINAIAGALFNLTNLIRGLLFSKEDKKVWKLVLVIAAYTACFAFSTYLAWGNWFMIFIAALPYVTLVIMSVLMWLSNGKYIRYFQVSLMSPAWIVHNIFNFSLGGILCESFNMISTIVSFIRYGKDGFENKTEEKE
ncbi:MAG: YgjV family protein [Clostridia bacterium]|nr:YgjV family protein [Clostridia bacterium]MBR6646243.1 YgjV family protein [Clostridia bacterium]